ncbi:cupin [Streptomyces sp. NPDC047981]|uniref:cupin domain-containing protein n=1 Tax=Streptomyces sp. NPDC047981 TaxID=3154610 RepID=UPI00343C672D
MSSFTLRVPPLPGGIGISRLRVYDWEAADGLRGGAPHLHLACTEGYVVLGGRGRVQTLNASGYAETELVRDRVVWFTPGTLHRLVNDDGRLEILVLMSNSGLPEAGDAVFPFPRAVLDDTEAYAHAAALDRAEPEKSARSRRDLALAGFAELRSAVQGGGLTALSAFHERAAELIRPRLPEWRAIVEAGPTAAVTATAAYLRALESGAEHLRDATVARAATVPRWGICGHLGACDLDGAVALPPRGRSGPSIC